MRRQTRMMRSAFLLVLPLAAACAASVDGGDESDTPSAVPQFGGPPAGGVTTPPGAPNSGGGMNMPGMTGSTPSSNEGNPAVSLDPTSNVPDPNNAGSDDQADDDQAGGDQAGDGEADDGEQPQPQPEQPNPACPAWPAANGSRNVSTTIDVSGTFDGGLMRFIGTGDLGNGSQQEGQDALFELAPGATLRNVILGNPAADGIHCQGACTLENVWWEDVGEDAATFRGNSDSQRMSVSCGGARSADDKVFQHNGAGTLTIENFSVENFGKLYRSCGNCGTQFDRHVVLRDITASGGGVLAGINSNLGDTAEFENITLIGDIDVCDRFTGNDTGAEPTRNGSGADGRSCIFTPADITQR